MPVTWLPAARSENGEDGILVHTKAFIFPDTMAEKFAFRSHLTRETSFSIDYDELVPVDSSRKRARLHRLGSGACGRL